MSIQQIEVRLVSKEAVKPSLSTPLRARNFRLSYVDQIMPLVPFFPTCGLVFYTATPHTQPLNIARLKSSLSETLAAFYPIAGRVGQSLIDCNDQGIPVIEAHVDCSLSDVLDSSRKLELVSKFLPPREELGIFGEEPITEVVHLAIQINVFSCGGVAIGWYDVHKIMDGMSSALFFKHWANLASGRQQSIVVHPNFEAGVTVFPPLPSYEPPPLFNGLKDLDLGPPPVVKRFVFKNLAIDSLKGRAASENVPHPSRFLAVAGFIWKKALQATNTSDELSDTILQLTIDMRSRINPPLPKESIGNLATIAIARAAKTAELPDLIARIREAVSTKNDEIKEFKGEKAVEGVRANWNELMEVSSVYKEKAYKLVSWCRLGFNDLDFGFGKPKLIVPTDGKIHPMQRNVIIMNDYADVDGDGIEAWLFLDAKEMAFLESDQEFLTFASLLPWYSLN